MEIKYLRGTLERSIPVIRLKGGRIDKLPFFGRQPEGPHCTIFFRFWSGAVLRAERVGSVFEWGFDEGLKGAVR